MTKAATIRRMAKALSFTYLREMKKAHPHVSLFISTTGSIIKLHRDNGDGTSKIITQASGWYNFSQIIYELARA